MVMSIYHYLMIKFPGEQPSLVVRVTAILIDYKEKCLDIYKVFGCKNEFGETSISCVLLSMPDE